MIKWLHYILLATIITTLQACTSNASYLTSFSNNQIPKPELIVCLGGNTEVRVPHCVSLLKKHPNTRILFTGATPNHTTVSTAQAMANYAKSLYPSLKDSQILLEPRSYDTIGDAIYSRLQLNQLPRKVRNITLVTNDFHSKRATYIFRRVFGNEYKITPSPAKTPHKVRETVTNKESKHLTLTKIMFFGVSSGDVAGFETRATLFDPKFPGQIKS